MLCTIRTLISSGKTLHTADARNILVCRRSSKQYCILEVLDTTLLADQLQRQSAAIREKAHAADAPPLPEGVASAIERYNQVDASLKGTENQFIRLSGT